MNYRKSLTIIYNLKNMDKNPTNLLSWNKVLKTFLILSELQATICYKHPKSIKKTYTLTVSSIPYSDRKCSKCSLFN